MSLRVCAASKDTEIFFLFLGLAGVAASSFPQEGTDFGYLPFFSCALLSFTSSCLVSLGVGGVTSSMVVVFKCAFLFSPFILVVQIDKGLVWRHLILPSLLSINVSPTLCPLPIFVLLSLFESLSSLCFRKLFLTPPPHSLWLLGSASCL